MTKRWLKYLAIVIAAAVIYQLFIKEKGVPSLSPRDYAEIVKSDTLRTTLEFNSISMMQGPDSIEGFHYELIEAFAHDHGLEVSVSPLMSMKERLKGLEEGRFDLIADGIPVTTDRNDSLVFSIPIGRNHQVLIQRKPQNAEDSLRLVTSQLDLAGKTLYIVKESPVILRIRNISMEIGDTIIVEEVDKYGPEQLLAMVAYGDIDYAVCDERIARMAADSLPQIDYSVPIGFTQFYAWGLNRKAPVLLDSVNTWLQRFMQTKRFKALAKKYHI
ncbi:MAG: transporter substrate-binding domain-containing protein [Bacteroidaceae bacterium]|nr:transporter substrate-binding domain-containing protein [Bacteroidaceae bacterium]